MPLGRAAKRWAAATSVVQLESRAVEIVAIATKVSALSLGLEGSELEASWDLSASWCCLFGG